jgi:hypothetical protein
MGGASGSRSNNPLAKLSSTATTNSSSTSPRQYWGRKLTVIFYLNTDDVQGHLRAYYPRQHCLPQGQSQALAQQSPGAPSSAFVEVIPLIGTMVIFRR